MVLGILENGFVSCNSPGGYSSATLVYLDQLKSLVLAAYSTSDVSAYPVSQQPVPNLQQKREFGQDPRMKISAIPQGPLSSCIKPTLRLFGRLFPKQWLTMVFVVCNRLSSIDP